MIRFNPYGSALILIVVSVQWIGMSTDVDMSMSLDGFIAAANDSPQEPAGEGDQRLQEWFAEDS